MNDFSEIIAKALQSGATETGFNYAKANKYMKENAGDGRYSLFCLAGTCSWNFNMSGTIQYRCSAYRFWQTKTNFNVKIDRSYSVDALFINGKQRILC